MVKNPAAIGRLQIPRWLEEQQDRIHGGLRLSEELRRLDDHARVNLDTLERLVRQIRQEDREAGDLDYVIDRFERLRELRNMAELASFTLRAEKALDAAWKRLP